MLSLPRVRKWLLRLVLWWEGVPDPSPVHLYVIELRVRTCCFRARGCRKQVRREKESHFSTNWALYPTPVKEIGPASIYIKHIYASKTLNVKTSIEFFTGNTYRPESSLSSYPAMVKRGKHAVLKLYSIKYEETKEYVAAMQQSNKHVRVRGAVSVNDQDHMADPSNLASCKFKLWLYSYVLYNVLYFNTNAYVCHEDMTL